MTDGSILILVTSPNVHIVNQTNISRPAGIIVILILAYTRCPSTHIIDVMNVIRPAGIILITAIFFMLAFARKYSYIAFSPEMQSSILHHCFGPEVFISCILAFSSEM